MTRRRALLALETSTLRADVAVLMAEGSTFRECARAQSDERTHAEELLSLIDAVLQRAEASLDAIDGIAIGAGPGSFTGLRIGYATAKGIATARALPIFHASSLAAVALDAARRTNHSGWFLPVLNALRGEIFYGVYRCELGRIQACGPEGVCGYDALETTLGPWRDRDLLICGETVGEHAARLTPWSTVDPSGPSSPRAACVGELAARDGSPLPASAVPAYLRPAGAELKFPVRREPGSDHPKDVPGDGGIGVH